uniref:Uncharacterized protein n=1 Tax=Oryza sativa subsp. japonica TaxID=39947 RepID=Q9FWT9_ORYSJ|nr:hypothetical protein [Oryza sativa Japonica Group]
MAPAAKRNLGKAPIVDDSDESDCDGELSRRELDDIIYEIFRKEVVKDVKKEILNRKSCSHAFRYAKTVCDIFGLPSGGLEFGKDFEAGKEYILSMYGLSCLPSVRFFGDQFIKKEPLTNEKVITSFLIVALACFLCPNSSILPSTKYLTIFQDVNNLRNYDWSKFIYDWSMNYMKKFVKTNSLGGCLYMWAVVYLDNVEFGDNNVSNEIPHQNVVIEENVIENVGTSKADDDIGISSAGISAQVHVPNDNVLPHSPIHNAFHGNEDAFVSKSAVELNDSRQCDDDLNFVTPQVGNANHSKQSVDDLLDGQLP